VFAALLAIALAVFDAVAEAHVAGLGSEDFATRQRASAALLAMGDAALPALRRHERDEDAEVRHRVEALLEAYHGRAGDMLPDGWKVLPWVDSIVPAPNEPEPSPALSAYRHWGDYLALAGGADVPPWPNYRAATRIMLCDLSRAGWSRDQLKALLNRMAAWEKVWCERRNYPVPYVELTGDKDRP